MTSCEPAKLQGRYLREPRESVEDLAKVCVVVQHRGLKQLCLPKAEMLKWKCRKMTKGEFLKVSVSSKFQLPFLKLEQNKAGTNVNMELYKLQNRVQHFKK